MRMRRLVRALTRLPGVARARQLIEKAVAPYVRADIHRHRLELDAVRQRIGELEEWLRGLGDEIHGRDVPIAELRAAVADLERHLPPVLNAIASTNGAARVLARRLDEVAARQPDPELLGWLLRRVETVRAETLYELRYGRSPEDARPEAKVLNAEALARDDVRVNLGAGHVLLDGYANVDLRELPGIDVVAAVDDLPVEPATLAEISSSHLLEHFPEQELRRRLLPYWFSMLRPGGVFRAVVPDLGAMAQGYADGEIPFDRLRRVAYGDQEYALDFHYTAFTPASLVTLLEESGFVDAEIIAEGRPNGDCLEFEIVASRPAT
jgi:hypothetical protein